jgi:hypothetical protein
MSVIALSTLGLSAILCPGRLGGYRRADALIVQTQLQPLIGISGSECAGGEEKSWLQSALSLPLPLPLTLHRSSLLYPPTLSPLCSPSIPHIRVSDITSIYAVSPYHCRHFRFLPVEYPIWNKTPLLGNQLHCAVLYCTALHCTGYCLSSSLSLTRVE